MFTWALGDSLLAYRSLAHVVFRPMDIEVTVTCGVRYRRSAICTFKTFEEALFEFNALHSSLKSQLEGLGMEIIEYRR